MDITKRYKINKKKKALEIDENKIIAFFKPVSICSRFTIFPSKGMFYMCKTLMN